MKKWDLVARIRHGLGRSDAARRLRVKILLKLFQIDFQKQTELNYLGSGLSSSKILSSSVYTLGTAVSFSDPGGLDFFQHSFATRNLISTSDVIVNTEKSLILDSNGLVLSESTEWPSEQVVVFVKKPPNRPLQRFESVRLGLSNSGYYHWLTEDLPSFLVNKSRFPVLEFSKTSQRNREIYNFLNVHTYLAPEWVFVDQLDFTTRGKDLGYLHPENLKVLKHFSAEQMGIRPRPSRKLYISRSRSRRSLPNEKDLEFFLEAQGYEIIFSEEHGFLDQIKLFSEATSIIAPHGAGLANTLWSNGVRILEIEPSEKINRCFEWQAKLCGHEYTRFRLLNEDLYPLFKFIQNWMH